jgi:hypothetical protein
VAPGAEVVKGAVVARFRVLHPEGDLSAVRDEQTKMSERQHVENAVTQMVTERDRAERDELAARLQRSEVVTRLEADLARARGELLQARTRRNAAAGQLASSRALREQQMVAQQDVDEKDAAFRVQEAEVQKADAALRSVERQKKAAEEIEQHLEQMQEAQARAREREVQEMQDRRVEAARREEAAGNEAARHQRLVEVRAPAAGVVAYRAPSPASTFGTDPLLAISPPDGFRVRLRLPTREVEALREEMAVDLDLINKRYLERRFSGRLVESHPIAAEPAWSVVEIAGLPPPDAVRDAVSPPIVGKADEPTGIAVALKWSPPFFQLPLFRTGLVLALVGAVLLASTIRLSRSAQEDPT